MATCLAKVRYEIICWLGQRSAGAYHRHVCKMVNSVWRVGWRTSSV